MKNKLLKIAAAALAFNLSALSANADTDGTIYINDGKEIYDALDVPAKTPDKITNMMSVTYTKSVGGLTCAHNIEINAPITESYSCELKSSVADYSAIYNALDIKAEPVPGIQRPPAKKSFKSVKNLDCYESDLRGDKTHTCSVPENNMRGLGS